MAVTDRSSGSKSRALQVPGPLLVTVLFTNVPETLEVLRHAASLASELGTAIRVLLPTVVPYHLDLEKPRVDPHFRLRHFRTLCSDHPVETFFDVRLCRDAHRCIQDSLQPQSLLLVASHRRWWKPFPPMHRLLRTLRACGHEVLEIPVKERSRPA